MSNQTKPVLKSQAGFTLVELAIVMIIIGLLIGGVLKGQALITNAQVTSTVSELKGIEAATTTFKDTYTYIPGDLPNPVGRLPNCAAGSGCAQGAGATNGNGILENTPAVTPLATEGEAYFPQLNAAGLFAGVAPAAGSSAVIGTNFPAGKISNTAIQMGWSPAGAAANFPGPLIGATLPSAGLYATVVTSPGIPTATSIKPDQASRIDAKIDDGAPDTGTVRAGGTAAAAAGSCSNTVTAGASTTYYTASATPTCVLYVHMQN